MAELRIPQLWSEMARQYALTEMGGLDAAANGPMYTSGSEEALTIAHDVRQFARRVSVKRRSLTWEVSDGF